MSNLKPMIYVACLAAYNNGYLHGEWIDADQDADSLHEEVKTILSLSPIQPSEEWGIHDFEGFGDVAIQEYTGLETVAEIAKFVVEHDELGAAVLAHVNNDIEEAVELLEDCYHGEHDSFDAFAYYWTHEVDGREIPDHLQYYIDYTAMARDYFISDFFSIEVGRKVHVFSQR